MISIIIGVDQGTYTATAGTRTISLSSLDFTPTIESLLYVYNITQDKTYYAAANTHNKCSISGNDIIFQGFFPVLGESDKIHIQFGYDSDPSTEAKQTTLNSLVTALNALVTVSNQKVLTDDKVHVVLQQIRDSINTPVYYTEATNSLITSGTSTVTLVNSTQTIGTVTTLTGQTNIGGFPADMITENNSYADWGVSVRSLLI